MCLPLPAFPVGYLTHRGTDMIDTTAPSTPESALSRALAGLFITPDDDIAERVRALVLDSQGLVSILIDSIEGQRDHRGNIDCDSVIGLLNTLDRNLAAARVLASRIDTEAKAS
jgi:hypothetical protein